MRMVLAGLLSVALQGVAAAHPTPPFACAMASTSNGWCDGCRTGYLATVEIRSAKLFESLDANGHNVTDPASMDCVVCRDAFPRNGYCGDCRIGFVGGHAFFTRLTYLLARGETRDTSTISCTSCSRAAADTTLPLEDVRWCDLCGHGMVGNVVFRDTFEYAAARKRFERLLRAVRESERCEDCAMALFHGGACRRCDITFKNGEPLKSKPAAEK